VTHPTIPEKWRIGLLAPRAHHFYAYEVVDGMRKARLPAGQGLLPIDLLYQSADEIPRRLDGREMDALILGLDQARYELYRDHLPDVPAVNVHPDRLTPEIPTIAIHAEALARASFELFRSLGIRSIASVYAGTTEAQQRVDARLAEIVTGEGAEFQRFELEARGIVSNYESHGTLPVVPDFEDWLRSLPHPTGILSSGGYSAMIAVDSARRAGLDVPGTISVLSRSDDLVCVFSDPPISSFRSVGPAVGELALTTLVRRLNGEALPRGEIRLPAPSIVERDSTGVPEGIDRTLRAAVRFIRSRALDGITVDDILASVPGLSRSRFYRQFEEHFGHTPAREIQRLRIEDAQFQLRYTRKSLNEIARACSFKTIAHFSTVFARETGLSPRKWRKLHQLNKD
jgi:LacI family transcriptional regulator